MADEPKEGGGLAGGAPGNNAPRKPASEKRTAAKEKPAAEQAPERAREPD